MKLNYKNTCLGFLDGSQPINFIIPENNKNLSKVDEITFAESVKSAFIDKNALPQHFKNNIRFISKPFQNAFEKTKSKLIDIFDKEEINECGTFIYTPNPSVTNTLFYSVETFGTGDDWKIRTAIFLFEKNTANEYPLLVACVLDDTENSKNLISSLYIKSGIDHMDLVAFVTTLLCFIKHCEIETKIIPAGKKDYHVGNKYLNETKSNITVLDSTWFTTVIRSGGFMVGEETGGFFKWQRYGIGLAKKKLIWVQPYEKEGYTRTAKVLNQNIKDENS